MNYKNILRMVRFIFFVLYLLPKFYNQKDYEQ